MNKTLEIIFHIILILSLIKAENVKEEQDETTKQPPTTAEKYGYGSIAIVVVSLLAVLGIVLLPCFKKSFYEKILRVLTALAVGTLFSDAMLHMMPEILGVEDESDDNQKIHVSDQIIKIVVVIASLYVFWLFEIILHRIIGKKIESHGHGHSHNLAGQEIKQEMELVAPNPENDPIARTNLGFLNFSNLKKVRPTGWIILAADAIHNLADGLAIGASFAQSLKLGLSTTIAVICHEVPHELGNYAVLVKCGFTHFQALFFNFLSATTSLIGFYIGVSISTDPQISLWIFSITAGMFIYVALVDLLPAIMSDIEWSWYLFIFCNIAMISGFAIMFLLVIFEDQINF